MKKLIKLGLVVAATPVVLAMGALCIFDMWLEYRKDPGAFDEMLESFLDS